MRPKLIRSAIYVLSVGVLFFVQPKLHSESASWSRDLVPDLGRSPRGTYHLAGVEFLDGSRLIVYAVAHNPSRLSSRETPEVSSPFRLHMWVVDASSGNEESHNEWGTRAYNSEVRIITSGVLLKTGGVLKLYSPDFALSHDLLLALDPNGSYFTSVSTSRRSLAVSHYFKKEQHYVTHVDVLDAKSFKVRASWDQYPPMFHFSMSDENFFSLHDGVVSITAFGGTGRSRIVAELGTLKGCAAGGAGPFVVSDELLVLRDCKEVLLLTSTGESFSLDAFNGRGTAASLGAACTPYFDQGTNKAAVAFAGTRFLAITLPVLRFKKPLLSESRTCLDGLHIAVYDLALKKRIATVNVDPLPKNDYDFALSPDGSKLAVLNDRIVSVYSVPARLSRRADTVDLTDVNLRVQVPAGSRSTDHKPKPQSP